MNTPTIITSRPYDILGSLFYDKRLLIRKKTPHRQFYYYIDEVIIHGDLINVDYTLNDEWMNTVIRLSQLKQFISVFGLNQYEFNASNFAGEHIQEFGLQNIDDFLAENLKVAIKAYFEVKKIGQINVN